MSISSSDSDSSQSSVDTVEHVLRQMFDYGNMIYSRFEDQNIDWIGIHVINRYEW
jgi:hypothetical protein